MSIATANLASLFRPLFTAVVGDVMDQMGYQNQFLPPNIRPLHDEMIVLGRAMPVLEADRSDVPAHLQDKPFGVMLEALDDLKAGEVYICSGCSPDFALWGELMSTRAQQLGAVGAVLDGYSRDTRGILALDFPTFSYGNYAQDQAPRGSVVDFRVPIVIGEVKVNPGDIIFGDLDGVCVIPQQIEAEVVQRATKKATTENEVRIAIEKGMPAVAAFEKYGVM